MRNRSISFFALTTVGIAAWVGCSDDGGGRRAGEDGGTGGGVVGGIGGSPIDAGNNEVTGKPWPAEPLFDEGVDAGAAGLFDSAPSGAGPCVSEPQDGAMLPRNWLRPRFRVAAAGGEDLFQITLSAAEMENDLVAYTKNPAWTMPKEFWGGIGMKANNGPVTIDVTIRAVASSGGGAVSEAKSTFLVAPVSAGGSMVYWASKASGDNVANSRLVGFRVGDEATVDALIPEQVSESDLRQEGYGLKSNSNRGTTDGKVSCIGCHTSTPDGDAVAFNDGWPWSAVTASVEATSVGQRPSYVTPLGARVLQAPFIGTTTFSKGHWATGARVAVATMTPWTQGPYDWAARNLATSADLIWVNLAAEGDADLTKDQWGTNDPSQANPNFLKLEGTAWGKLARSGDSRAAANPAWSNSGDVIAYTSTARVAGSHVGGIEPGAQGQPDREIAGATEADIFTVPYSEGAGGTATPLAGASSAGVAEYYADFSADDKLVSFNRAGTDGYIYYRPDGEIYVVSSSGGEPTRLAANDPAACTGEASPGVINSWAKWSPSVSEGGDGRTYYWLIFSSARKYPQTFNLQPDAYTPTTLDTRSSQLYLAAVVTDASGAVVQTTPAVYIWNQTTDTSNLTPAWDEFKIPEVIIK